MSAFRSIALVSLALSSSLPALAATDSADASCRQARKDLQFLQQLAATDGNSNPYINAQLPAACKVADSMTPAMPNEALKKQADSKNYAGAPAARRYN